MAPKNRCMSMVPPTMASTKWTRLPQSVSTVASPRTFMASGGWNSPPSGSTRIEMSANWPAPPVCFLWRYRASARARTVSR